MLGEGYLCDQLPVGALMGFLDLTHGMQTAFFVAGRKMCSVEFLTEGKEHKKPCIFLYLHAFPPSDTVVCSYCFAVISFSHEYNFF